MKDKVLIMYGPLADFATCEWGVLKVVDGVVVLDKTKAFNRARRMMNAGCNTFRTLRRGIWSTIVGYDWEDAGYWDIFREYLSILHMPVQGTWYLDGADVLVELFDRYDDEGKKLYEKPNWEKARKLMRSMFTELDFPWVKFGAGNELNLDIINFLEQVVYPEFKKAGKIPFSYGAHYDPRSLSDPKYDFVGKQKGAASLFWNSDDVSFAIFKQVHGIKDKNTADLLTTAAYWVNGCSTKLRTVWSVDGVFDGASDCDWAMSDKGKIQRRPSPAQWRSAVKYILDLAKDFDTPAHLPRFGFEYLPKAINADECSAKGVLAISEEYKAKWGVWPENYGKYPDDYVPPISPEPPEPEPPIPPAPEPEKSCYEKFIADRPFWKWQVGKFIQCLF